MPNIRLKGILTIFRKISNDKNMHLIPIILYTILILLSEQVTYIILKRNLEYFYNS